MSSKLEINIRSLLSHCEELAKEDGNSWTLKKYIKSLDTMIMEFETIEKSNSTVYEEYFTRCAKIKKEINYIESPPISRKLKLKSKGSDGESIINEISQIRKSNFNNDMRKELLGGDGNQSNILRKRGAVAAAAGGSGGAGDMGQAMKFYGDMQEKIAEDMLIMTRSLKEQTETANKIIKRDTEIVSSSAQLSDKNLTSLSSEADKLQDHSKRAWKCWMWIMIGLVMMIFISMVLFMKIMKKKAVAN